MAFGFHTRLRAELVDHLANDGQGAWDLISPLIFEDRDGNIWAVPAGFTTDYSSVPRAPIVYLRYGNRAHAPAAVHDWAIRTKACTREYADQLFLQAMESIGMADKHVGPMFRAVSAETRNIAERENPSNPNDYPR
jgi:hypothetical protein